MNQPFYNSYDAYGRFAAVTATVQTVTQCFDYGYLLNSDMLATMMSSDGLTVTRTYDPVMPHITGVHNGFTGGRTISQYDYTYDALGRRTAIANSGEAFTFTNANDLAAFNLYGYNGRSEVTSAARYWGTDTGDTSEAVDGQQYAYAFDPIGNRVTAAEGDTSRAAAYTANALNQYSQRTVPGVKELAGTALTNATVTVNGLSTDRHGPWWRHAFAVDNGSAAAYTQAVVTAVYNPPGTNDPDVVTAHTGRVFVAETPEQFQYDDDGNLTQDGRFTYTWDAENRLISATTRDDLPAGVPRVRVTHVYDHQSRRIATAQEVWSGSAWQPSGTNRYVYDGWNLVAEVRAAAPANTNLYVWCLDLSGTLQGAGGIGGLLTVRKRLDDGVGLVRNLDYLHDANGNVVQEIMRNDGSIHAHYEYDSFGTTVVATGVDATDNPFRFSTKWFDNDTGLGYWGYRWYSPGMGRWVSRDPIGKKGGMNIYAILNNAAVCKVDILGLWPGFVTCALTGTKGTSAWTFMTYSPKDLVDGTGGAVSPYATCIYTRTATETYTCSCKCPKTPTAKTITQKYYSTVDVSGIFIWIKPGGKWPPLTFGAGDIIGGIVTGILIPPIPDPSSAASITSQCNAALPPATTTGTPTISPPKKFCWWK